MPRKPNYRFERFERERTRAAKKAARAQAKADKKKAGADATDHDPSGETSSAQGDESQTSD
jgi:hypothetical protein